MTFRGAGKYFYISFLSNSSNEGQNLTFYAKYSSIVFTAQVMLKIVIWEKLKMVVIIPADVGL